MSSPSGLRVPTVAALAPRSVLPADEVGDATELATPELRIGQWTRLGGRSAVLGDAVVESLVGELAEEARAAARAQGYAVGWAEGRRTAAVEAEAAEARRALIAAEAEARREAEHAAALAALASAAEEVRGRLEGLAAGIEEQAISLAWAVTEVVVGDAVAGLASPEVVARVLQVLPAVPVATVRLHPAHVGGEAAASLVSRGLSVVADPTLEYGDALVEAPDGSITDLRVSSALERVREVLR